MTENDNRGICRLCLLVESQNMHSLTDHPEILRKIQECFSINIVIEDSYPKQICGDCKIKIEDIHDYHCKVNAIEKLLKHYAIMGQNYLNQFYLSLKIPEVKVKEENESVGSSGKRKETLKEESKGLEPNHNVSNVKSNICSKNEIKVKALECPDNHDDGECYSPIDTLNTESNTINSHNSKTVNKPDKEIFTNEEDLPKFKCLTCFKVCDDKKLLLSHYNTIHKPIEKTKADFVMLEIDGNVMYKCKVCEKVSVRRIAAMSHMREHNVGRPFTCKVCGRTYQTAAEIVRHGRAHDGSKMFCSHNCGYSTAYMGALIEHEKRHSGDHKYKCEQCGKGFQVKTWYLQHQNIHKGLKPFVCDICGVAFHMDRYLTAHKSSVHPQSSHVKRYVCPHCSLPCDSRKTLTDHLKEHGIRSSFLCDLCGKTLSNSEQLKFHKRMHLGVKPFSCSTCNKSFAKKFNLQLHERTHSGEKSHECALCGKCYTQRSTLLRHQNRQHSETKQHHCTRCTKTFSSSSQLTSHQDVCI